MKKRLFPLAFLFLVASLAALPAPGQGLEKLKYGVSVRLSPPYWLPFLAAEEQGYWKASGFEAEYVPFRGGPDVTAALAAGHLNIGTTMAATVMQAAAGGVPVLMVTNIYPKEGMYMWVRAESAFKELKDLKGAKIGVHRFGTTSHAYARMALAGLGLEGQAKFVSTGGVVETVAAVKVEAVDAAGAYTLFSFLKLAAAGQVRSISRLSDYLPTPWTDHVVYTTKAFARTNPESLRRSVRAIVQGMQFAANNPRWVMDKMKAKEWTGFTESEARLVMEKEGVAFSKDGKFDRRAVENVRRLLIEYGIVSEDKVPSADELFTNRLLE